MRIARTEVLSVEATGERCDSERITHRSVEGRWKRIGEDTSLAAYPTLSSGARSSTTETLVVVFRPVDASSS